MFKIVLKGIICIEIGRFDYEGLFVFDFKFVDWMDIIYKFVSCDSRRVCFVNLVL